MIARWLNDAILDVRSVRAYIRRENPAAAKNVAKKIFHAASLLSEQSGMGRPGRIIDTRELVVPGTPYIVLYRVKNHAVEILRVFHSAIQWPNHIMMSDEMDEELQGHSLKKSVRQIQQTIQEYNKEKIFLVDTLKQTRQSESDTAFF